MLAQCEDGSIVLISIITNSVICYFQAISSKITEAKVHVLLEYLLVSCDDGYVYVYNMIVQALERVVTGFGSCMLLRKPLRNRVKSENFENIETSGTYLSRTLQFNFRQQFEPKNKHPLTVTSSNIGGSDIPILHINTQAVANAIKSSDNPGGNLEYVISLLTC